MRIGTQIEQDFNEAKRYWSQANADEQRKKPSNTRELQAKHVPANTRVVQPVSKDEPTLFNVVNIPIILRRRFCSAMVDTGSTLTLMRESLWKQLSQGEPCESSEGQVFMLANGQRHKAIGRVQWQCEIQGQRLQLTIFILRDRDLTANHPWYGFFGESRGCA